MREIKFRAWDEKRKHYLGNWEYVIDSDGRGVLEQVGCDPEYEKFRLNHEATLEQYTGLHDKNSREIYEGDVVQFKHSPYQRGVVIFEGFFFNIEGFWDSSYDYPSYAFSEGNNYEVIGNIHENKELLEKKQ